MKAAEFFKSKGLEIDPVRALPLIQEYAEKYHQYCDRWRPFPEEKPEERGWYLCSTVDTDGDKGTVVMAWEQIFKDWNYSKCQFCTVTHWKPINPPK